LFIRRAPLGMHHTSHLKQTLHIISVAHQFRIFKAKFGLVSARFFFDFCLHASNRISTPQLLLPQ
jgi:hypothetical protein